MLLLVQTLYHKQIFSIHTERYFMGLFSKIAVVGILTIGLKRIKKSSEERMIENNKIQAEERKHRAEEQARRAEEKKRINTEFEFNDGISQTDFEFIVKKTCNHIKRLVDYRIEGPIIYGQICSQSGATIWKFKIDFNDYGHLTGRYWLTNENPDSTIPHTTAIRIQRMIETHPSFVSSHSQSDADYDLLHKEQSKQPNIPCPYCGHELKNQEAKFCPNCGKRLFV